MFFIMGISQGNKELIQNAGRMNICKNCGSYTTYKVFMTYMYLSIFFIPIFKWNIKYYAQSSCCKSIFILDKEKGKMIKNGEDVIINDADLTIVNQYETVKNCKNCGYQTTQEFDYCPKCGNKL